ncbi:hypothetical protein FS749_010817 [Ceratobasidium sp. UAMH 11750]|nr:hypothetical protein FS749_010817 [Ceratobasidium sp. UAMH 11750]
MGTVSGKRVRQHTHTQGEAAPKAQSEEDQPSEAEEDDRDRANDDPPPEQSQAPRLALSGQDAADRRKAARVQAHEVEREKRLKDAEDAAKKAAKAPKGSTGGKKSRKGKSQAEGDAMLDNDTGGAQRPPEDVAGPSSRPDGARQEPQATKAKVGRPRKTANDPEKPGSTSSTKRNKKNMAEPNKPVTRSGATVPVRHITAAPE